MQNAICSVGLASLNPGTGAANIAAKSRWAARSVASCNNISTISFAVGATGRAWAATTSCQAPPISLW